MFFFYSSRQTGRTDLHLQPFRNWCRSRTLSEYLCKLAGCNPPCYLSAVYQHSAGQPTHCHVQVPKHYTSVHCSTSVGSVFPPCFDVLSAATPFLKFRSTVTSTGNFSVTISLWSTTIDHVWHHHSSSSPIFTFLSRDTSARFLLPRVSTLVRNGKVENRGHVWKWTNI